MYVLFPFLSLRRMTYRLQKYEKILIIPKLLLTNFAKTYHFVKVIIQIAHC